MIVVVHGGIAPAGPESRLELRGVGVSNVVIVLHQRLDALEHLRRDQHVSAVRLRVKQAQGRVGVSGQRLALFGRQVGCRGGFHKRIVPATIPLFQGHSRVIVAPRRTTIIRAAPTARSLPGDLRWTPAPITHSTSPDDTFSRAARSASAPRPWPCSAAPAPPPGPATRPTRWPRAGRTTAPVLPT